MSSLKFRSASFFIGACFLAFSTLSVGILITTKCISQQAEETTYAWTGTQTPSVTDSYYSQASGLTGSALKSKLYTFNKPVSKSYDWGRYEAADEAYNNSNYVICLYTRHDIPKSAHVGGSYSWDTWNREHIYTQSAFPNSDTDNHNIFACEGQINNYRGNLKFGEVTHNSTNQLTVFGHLTNNYKAGSYFEPCDEAKGEVARAVLYTSLYYNYTIPSIFQSEAVCLKWHAQFPVTQREIFRNNRVHTLQGNRNPFVDHPSYANSIYNPSTPYTGADPLGGSTSTAPNTITLSPATPTIEVSKTVTLNVTVDTGSSSVTWASSNNSVATVSGGIVTGVAVGTATITATSTINTSVKGTATITVKSLSSLSLSGTATNKSYSAGQSFNPAGLTVTATYSDSSTANVTSSVAWTPSPLIQGTTSVTGSYGGKTVSVSGLTVTAPVEKTLSSISVSGYQTSFEVGDTFSFGGAVTATYSDSSTADVTSSSSFTGYNMSTEGTQTVTASYTYGSTTKTSTYQITVAAPTTPVDSGTYTIGWGTATGTTGTFTNFSAVTGSVADILSFTSAKNSATSPPAYNDNSQELRLYFVASGDGCSITITPVQGITFTGFVITASTSPTVKYTVNGGTATSISASNTTYTVTGLSASTSLTIQNGNTTNTQLRIKTIALTYSVAGQSEKIVDGLSASYSGGNVYVDGSLNTSSVSVTASYTDSATYPNAILNSSDYSLSGFSSSTAGQKTVTVTYTGSLSTSSTPMTTTFNVNVVADTLTDVSVANSNTYHPGETITKSDITVTLAYASGASTTTSNFTFDSEGYQFTYADANSGGSNTSKQFSVVYSGNSYYFSVNVSRVSYSTASDSANALTGTEFNGSTVSKSSGTPSSTAVTIGGVNFTVTTNAYIYSSCLSFAKTAGSINNSTAFSSDLTSVSYVEKSGYRQDAILTISQDGNSWTAYSEIEIANGGYRFFKIEYTGTSTLYSNISSISFTLAGEDSATNVANYVMYEDTDNQCTTKLSEAIDKLNAMSETEKNTFWTSSDYVISTSRERLLAWATHEGKELTYSDGVFQISNSRNIASISNQSNNSLIIMVVSMFGLTAVGGFFFLRRKKEN